METTYVYVIISYIMNAISKKNQTFDYVVKMEAIYSKIIRITNEIAVYDLVYDILNYDINNSKCLGPFFSFNDIG